MASLLVTKLHIPRLGPETVPRPRLIESLDAGRGRQLTLVSAPPGFGKTTLLSEWIIHCGCPAAWVSLDRDDNDPVRFWSYVIAALHTTPRLREARVGEAALALLQAPATTVAAPPPIEAVLTTLINGMAETSERPILVLDDYHLIVEQQIHDTLFWFLDHLSPSVHLVLSTRSDPPWPMARLRAQRQLSELRAEDLRFTLEETASFLNGVIGLRLSAEDIAALDARTEGWIAGLQMAAISMQGREDVPGFIRAFGGGHRFVLGYLVEEVLDRQPAHIQSFLLQTSILERMTAPLCDAVTGRDDSRAILAHLERANLFLVPLDDEHRWYRYHHLFADLLQGLLRQAQPDEVAALHRRASAWHDEHGLFAQAVSHALSAGDVERVASLLEGRTVAATDRIELGALLRWLDTLPAAVVRSRPWLCLTYAWALAYVGRLGAIESLLESVERGRPELQGAERERIAGQVAALRAYRSTLAGEAAAAAEHALRALAHLPREDEDMMARSVAAMALSFATRQGQAPPTADSTLAEFAATCRRQGDSHLALTFLADLAQLHISGGRLHMAMDVCREALALAASYEQESGRELPAEGCIYSRMGLVLREWNDLAAAARYGRMAVEKCQRWGLVEALVDSYAFLALTLQSAGDSEGALAAIREAKPLAAGISPWYVTALESYEARILLAQGDVASVTRLGIAREDKPTYIRIRLLLAQGRPDEALRLIEPLLEDRQRAGSKGVVISLLVLQALAWQAQRRIDQALAALERALALAQPEGHVRTFVDEGAPMLELLRELKRRGLGERGRPLSRYVESLLAAFAPGVSSQAAQPPAPPVAPIWPVEPLSERELEVLRLLATDLSTAEIASRLFVAMSTLRTHTKRIYGKLQVHGRMAAVARARELGLA